MGTLDPHRLDQPALSLRGMLAQHVEASLGVPPAQKEVPGRPCELPRHTPNCRDVKSRGTRAWESAGEFP